MEKALYNDGDNWILKDGLSPNKQTVPLGSIRRIINENSNEIQIVSDYTNKPLINFTPVTEISKNAAGDKYEDLDTFLADTKAVFLNSLSDGSPYPYSYTERKIEDLGDTIYVGYSKTGELTSGNWTIKKISIVGNITDITYGIGSWDDRATLTYN